MNENIQALLGRDTAVTQQFFDTLRRGDPIEPERALLAALLQDAIHDYRKFKKARDREGRERFREVEEWINESASDWIFSFNNVCELLNLEPDCVRRALHERKRRTPNEDRPRRHDAPGPHA
ncbi:MAG: hypothetical protein ACREQ2_15630 [Candidatus Binatia bacterium]